MRECGRKVKYLSGHITFQFSSLINCYTVIVPHAAFTLRSAYYLTGKQVVTSALSRLHKFYMQSPTVESICLILDTARFLYLLTVVRQSTAEVHDLFFKCLLDDDRHNLNSMRCGTSLFQN